NGPETARMQGWPGQQPGGQLVISDWVATEFSSALSVKLRTRQIGPVHRADAMAMLTRLATESLINSGPGVAVAVPQPRPLRRPTRIGVARRRCTASRCLRRSWREALHTRETAMNEERNAATAPAQKVAPAK